MVNETLEIEGDLLASLLAEDTFLPVEPRTLQETGLPASFIEGMILKSIAVSGTSSGRNISDHICLPFGILEEVARLAAHATVAGSRRLSTVWRLLLHADRPRQPACDRVRRKDRLTSARHLFR